MKKDAFKMTKIRDVVGKLLLATLLAITSLLVGVAPLPVQADAGDPSADCGHWFFFIPTPGSDPEPCPEPTDDDLRALWAREMLGALESYGGANGTYLVPDSGFDGSGNGWAIYEGNRYATSIASRLSAEGFFPPLETSRYWDRTEALATSEGVVAVYRCKDRVAVFNFTSSGQASRSDRDWWADNGCFRYPIDQLGATDYEVSRPLSHLDGANAHEDLRVAAVDAMLEALQSYQDVNHTFQVPNSGFGGGGAGWGFYEGGGYSKSIASVLIAEGHLSADPLHDPHWGNTTSLASGEGAVLVYRCKDRVAVFASHSTAQTSAIEADWWADNGCTRYPIDQLGATYYRVSTPACGCTGGGHFFFS